MMSNFSKSQNSIYDQFVNLDVAYLPDENKTYFVDNIEVSTNSEDEDLIKLIGIRATINGNHIDYLVLYDPSLKPVVKSGKLRERYEDYPGVVTFACIKSGVSCVVLLDKKQHLGGF